MRNDKPASPSPSTTNDDYNVKFYKDTGYGLWYSTVLILEFDFGLVECYVAFYIVRSGLGFRVVPKGDLDAS